jgi:hypothetical protein
MELNTACPECGTSEQVINGVCAKCGAERGDHRHGTPEGMRSNDLEPYITLRYIARLFKVLAFLMIIMMIAEIVTGIMTAGATAFRTLIGEITQMLVLAGLMWGVGDLALLLVDAGHDLRATRILLGRINARLHGMGSIGSNEPEQIH